MAQIAIDTLHLDQFIINDYLNYFIAYYVTFHTILDYNHIVIILTIIITTIFMVFISFSSYFLTTIIDYNSKVGTTINYFSSYYCIIDSITNIRTTNPILI